MSKVAALEEMYLIYQVFRSYLTEPESWGVEELRASYRSFCQGEPVGGMFLEAVLEELLERVREGKRAWGLGILSGPHREKQGSLLDWWQAQVKLTHWISGVGVFA
jgi:hypothetical protein